MDLTILGLYLVAARKAHEAPCGTRQDPLRSADPLVHEAGDICHAGRALCSGAPAPGERGPS